ncbi:translocation/assembly module TamB [Halomonas sp. PA5]|nr:translocation/assembly module TamB domain-containing protein [Halomonas populi]QJQ97210.1 translocation/assembly module TamB [Halomonas sp. PA5]
MIFVLGLILSPWGTGVLLDQAQQRGWLEYRQAQGAPLDHLMIEGLRLDAGPANVAIERLELRWADDCLLRGRLCIDNLAVEGARITLSAPDGTEPDEPATTQQGDGMGDIHLPFPLVIRTLSLVDVDLRLADGTHVEWNRFTSGLSTQGDSVVLRPTYLTDVRVSLPVSPGSALALSVDEADGTRHATLSADAIDASIAAQSPLPAVAAQQLEAIASVPLEARDRLALPEIDLPLEIVVPQLVVENVELFGPIDYRIERLALAVAARGHSVRLNTFDLRSKDARIRLRARVELRDGYPLEGRLLTELFLPELMPELAGERLDLHFAGSLAELDLQLDAQGPVAAEATARLNVLDPTLPFLVTLRADEVQWPLPGAVAPQEDEADVSPYRAEQLVARVEGNLLEYQAALSVLASGPEVPTARLALNGRGDLQRFAWTPLSIALQQGGTLISHGEASWTEGLQATTHLRLNNLDPGLFTEAVEGRLSGTAEIAFAQALERWQLDIPSLAIRGELQELPLALDARLSGNSEMQWHIQQLDFRQGDNRLTAEGRIDERLSLSGAVNAPALAALSPELEGSLRGDFDVSGTFEAPQLRLDLIGESLRLADNRLDELTLQARVQGLDDPRLDIQLDIVRLLATGQRFSSVEMNLEGRLSSHQLSFEALAGRGMPLSRAALTLEGGMNAARTRYRGTLTPLEIDAELADIRLLDPLLFIVNLEAGSVQAQPFCLGIEQGGRLCVSEPLNASANQGSGSVSLEALPMVLLEEMMPEGWQLGGETGADMQFSWGRGGAQWAMQMELASDLALQGLDVYGQPWTLPASRLHLDVDANQARASASLGLDLSEAGDLHLDVSIDDPVNQGAMQGRLRLNAIQLSPYQALGAAIQQLEGSLNGDVAIAGSLTAPSLSGDIRLQGLQVIGADVPVQVRDGELHVALNDDRADIQGFMTAEEGRLEIRGDAAWPSPDDWRAAITLDGRSAPLLAELPDFGRLRIAPYLEIDIIPSLLQVRGRVDVPWARLVIGQIPAAAITPSSDEIIITRRDEMRAQRETERAAAEAAEEGFDESAASVLAESGMAIDVMIDLVLGPDMLLEAYGLEAGLNGNLEVRQQEGPVQLFGDVNMTDGRFRAFGQDLLIRRGQLLFSGPADQPLLQFEAIRNPAVTEDDVVAGLRVTGSAEAPNLEVFSEPAMDEGRALSYLLRGRAPGDGDADGALASALIGLSLSRTGGAVGQLGQAFGIDDLALETAGTGEESQVVVSGQLTEDLRISYGMGIFSPIAELTLRYTLWRNLYLQAVSGAAQAVDLVYGFSLGRAETSPEYSTMSGE